VKVKRDGVSVSHRRGYVIADPKRDAGPASGQLQAAEAIAKGLFGRRDLRSRESAFRTATRRAGCELAVSAE
jgi:hypothetical protein